MIAPPLTDIVHDDLDGLVPDVRDVISRYPFLAMRGPESVCKSLRSLLGMKVGVCAVEAAIEALEVEGEVLA